MAKGNLFRSLRIAVLLYVLAMVATGAYLARARSTDWNDTLWLTLYPVAPAPGAAVAPFVASLSDTEFAEIEVFMRAEAERYGIGLDPAIRVRLGDKVATPPPPRPVQQSPFANALWSLRLRFWAWRAGFSQSGPTPDIRIFLVYHDPAENAQLPHSVGLQRGLLGVAHIYADRRARASNNIVIAHELLHTLGASDKYDPIGLMPIYPAGYADPDAAPLLPQSNAEIMAGRIPIDGKNAEMPHSLSTVVIGPATASEIGLRP
jgi:hypothetical protein